MTRVRVSLLLFLALYVTVMPFFTSYLRHKPVAEKIGEPLQTDFLRLVTADQRFCYAAGMIMQVLSYFGGIVERSDTRLPLPADYPAMSRKIHAALKLDPYNIDGYYFAQATLVWDAHQIRLANELLDYGMQYRDWDWYLPFFAGFNHAYFLKEYGPAARYYRRAAEISKDPLFMQLAGRYFQQSGHTDLAIGYLAAMINSARNETVKLHLKKRLAAFQEVKKIEVARDRYRSRTGNLPVSVGVLVAQGDLADAPEDPYGGTFYLDTGGRVASTSKFADSPGGKTKR